MNKSLTEHVQETRERLAEIEHEQWIAWSRDIAKTENISEGRLMRWQKLWCPYNELTEAQKDQDREWGDKAFLSQLKTIELVKEELEGMKKELHSKGCVVHKLGHGHCTCQMPIVNSGYNSALSQAITLLDTIIQSIKAQMK